MKAFVRSAFFMEAGLFAADTVPQAGLAHVFGGCGGLAVGEALHGLGGGAGGGEGL